MPNISLESLYCKIDDWVKDNRLSVFELMGRRRKREGALSISELITLGAYYPCVEFRHLKAFHSFCRKHLRGEFPKLPSYGRFKLLLNDSYLVLEAFLRQTEPMAQPLAGVGAIDSTLLPIGKLWLKNERKSLIRDGADLGHGTNGECLGFKLSLVTCSAGKLRAADVLPASTHDLNPVKNGMLDGFKGWIVGDSGYRSETLRRAFKKVGLMWIAKPRATDKRKLSGGSAALYKFRKAIESTYRELKQSFGLVPVCQCRSIKGWLAHLWGCLIAYQLADRQPRMFAKPC